MCLCCCQQVQVYLVDINCSQICALVTFSALLNHVLCVHHHLCLLLAVTPHAGETLEEVVLKGSHQMLQTGGKQMLLNNKGTFDPGLGKKALKASLP